jgi:hypothetical protein
MESGSINPWLCGSFIHGLRSALISGKADLKRFTTVAILLASSKLFACSDAFTDCTPSNYCYG